MIALNLKGIKNSCGETNKAMAVEIKENPLLDFTNLSSIEIKEEVDICDILPGFVSHTGIENSYGKTNEAVAIEIKEEPLLDIANLSSIVIKEEVDVSDILPGYSQDKCYVCYHCEEEFGSFNQLRRHIRRTHLSLNKRHIEKRNSSYRGLNETKDIQIKEEPLWDFTNLSGILIKKEVDISDILPGYKFFACYHCGEEFFSVIQLRQHMKKTHLNISDKQHYICYHCGRKFKLFLKLQSHIKRMHLLLYKSSPSEYGCRINLKNSMKKVFNNTNNKRRKSTKSMVAKRTNELVPECIRSNFSYFGLLYSEKGCKMLVCDECDKKFRSVSQLLSHIQTAHKRDKPYNCPACDHESLRLGDLKRHYVSRHTEEKTFSCTFCAYTTSRSSTLNRHYRAYHYSQTIGVVTYSCPHCPYTSIRRDHLRYHSQSLHHGGRNVNCTHLGCPEKSKIGAEKDMKKCPHCDKQTHSKGTLRKHIKDKHSKENNGFKKKIYECPYCEYTVTYLPCLKSHISVKHTGERPFKCRYCSYNSTVKYLLVRHLKRQHYEPE